MRSSLLCLALLVAVGVTGCKKDPTCPADQQLCGGACIAVGTDHDNCGACGHACGAGQTCSASQCECPEDRTVCGLDCADLASDPAHCGSCPVACDPGQVCTTPAGGAATCASACAEATQTSCSGACVDLAADRWNCGACGRACGTRETCSAGRCTAALYVACFNTDEVREATPATVDGVPTLLPAGVPLTVDHGPGGLTALDGTIYVSSAAYGGAEAIDRILRDPPRSRVERIWDTNLSTADIEFLGAHAGYLWVSHTSAKSLLVLSPSGAVVEEHFFAGTEDENPNVVGVAFAGDAAYVALEKRDEVAVLDVSAVGACERPGACIRELKRIDVSALASPGARALPTSITVAGDRAYVTLLDLDAGYHLVSGSTGRLAVIDVRTNTLDETAGAGGLVDLGSSCLDPAGLAVQGTTLWVTCGAFQGGKIVGQGIVPIDLSATVPALGTLVPVPDDAAPGDLVFCGETGYVGDRNSGRVFVLDPAHGTVQGVELCPKANGWAYVPAVLCGQ